MTPIARAPRYRCKDCGKHADEVPISRNGLCPRCAFNRQQSNILAMRGAAEPANPVSYERWLAGVARAGRPITPYSIDAPDAAA